MQVEPPSSHQTTSEKDSKNDDVNEGSNDSDEEQEAELFHLISLGEVVRMKELLEETKCIATDITKC